jgi:hypothetical protein
MIFLAEHPKYEQIYFVETFGHKPPVRVSKKTEKIMMQPKQENSINMD